MKINPISKPQYNYKAPSFQHRRQVLQNSVELAKQVPADVLKLKFQHLIEQNKKQQSPNFVVWCWQLIRNGNNIGKTCLENSLGFILSQGVYNLYTTSRDDFSKDISLIRNSIMDENFIVRGFEQNSTKESVENANKYVYTNFREIIATLRLLGTESVLTAIKLKQHRFEALINDVHSYYSYYEANEPDTLELIKAKTMPEKTKMYKDLIAKQGFLKKEMNAPKFSEFYLIHNDKKAQINQLEKRIKELKQSFTPENKHKIKELYAQITELRRDIFNAKPAAFNQLESQMTNIKAEINKLLQDSIKDPLEKIQLFHIYNSIQPQNYRKEICKLNSAITAGKEILLNHLAGMVQAAIGLTDTELQTFKNLKITESYYFPKLFEASNATKRNFKNLLKIISAGDGNLEKTFNDLEQNKITRELFEKEGLDYDTWSTFNPERDCIQIDENTVIKKVDMNDIKHSLFLGNHVSCCTAIGSGARSHIAPNYIKNKFVQAIELVVNGESVANTMCYIANLGEGVGLGLIIDNVETLKPYNTNPKTLDYFLMMAKKMLSDIGKPEMKIYCGNRMEVQSDKFSDSWIFRNVHILGHTGNDEINLDSIGSMSLANEKISLDSKYMATYFTL